MNAIDNCLLENFTSGVPYNELSANTVKGGGDQVYELNFDKEYLQNTNFNNYADHLLSNAEVLRQARIVYEADLTNQEIIRGKDMDKIQNEKSMKAIQAKLNMIAKDWRSAFDNQKKEYDRDTLLLKANTDNKEKSNVIMRKQDKEMQLNFDKMNDMKNNILTLRRQVDISMNESLRKNNKLFILRVVFIYLLFSIIPILLQRDGSFSNKFCIFLMIILTILFFAVIIWNIYHTGNRYGMRYTVRKFDSPSVEEILKKEEDDTEEEEDEKDAEEKACQIYLKKFQNLYVRAKVNDQYCKAGDIKKVINTMNQDIALGKKWCGFGTRANLFGKFEEVEKEMSQDLTRKIQTNKDRISAIRDALLKKDTEIKNAETLEKMERKQAEDAEEALEDSITEKERLIQQLKDLGGDYVNTNSNSNRNSLVNVQG
tara:strand:- start:11524 stop:12807 length:1284 start_codon:yes stop_codon:yes gene_type:complete